MKRISRICCTLATLLMSLGAVTSANADLLAFSPNPALLNGVITGGMPAWFQGQDGIAVTPCLDIGRCGLVLAPPLVYPTNFPDEFFYFLASTNPIPLGTSSCFVESALEIVFTTATGAAAVPTTPGALSTPFQRLRMICTAAGGAGALPVGNYSITTPWGGPVIVPPNDPNFRCVNQGGDTKCTFVRDTFSFPPVFTNALGAGELGAISNFLRDPAAPAGFLGTGGGAASFLGGTVGNIYTVTDAFTGVTASTGGLATLFGQTIGMDVQPGVNFNFGGNNLVTPALVAQTVTVTNTTGNAITFPADLNALAVKGGTDPADFAIVPPAAAGAVNCANATLLATAVGPPAVPAGTCSFDVTFPLTNKAAKAARSAFIRLAPTTGILANDPPPVTLNLSGTAEVSVTTTAAGHGSVAPIATTAVPAGSPVTITATPASNKFKVRDVTADVTNSLGTLAATATLPNTPPFTLDAGATNHTVTATFMPSGDLDANGTLDVADAVKALKIVAGVKAADADDPDNTAVKVAPLVGGKPAPDAGRVATTVGDVLVILRRVVGLDAW